MGTITDEDFQELLRWVRRESEIHSLMLDGWLGFSEFVLQQQLNRDRLVGAPTVRPR